MCILGLGFPCPLNRVFLFYIRVIVSLRFPRASVLTLTRQCPPTPIGTYKLVFRTPETWPSLPQIIKRQTPTRGVWASLPGIGWYIPYCSCVFGKPDLQSTSHSIDFLMVILVSLTDQRLRLSRVASCNDA